MGFWHVWAICAAILLVSSKSFENYGSPRHQSAQSIAGLKKASAVAAATYSSLVQRAKAAGIPRQPRGTTLRSKIASSGDTNEVVGIVNGIRQKRLGGGDIIVSEVGLGTQRWVSDDFNAPDEKECFAMMDEAILNGGINLIDTAEQYPIPSSQSKPEGSVETTIGKWLKQDKGRRDKVVLATKITGGGNINRNTLRQDCIDSMKRMNTDYIDVYTLHWPARYTPQSNWGQSLQYTHEYEPYYDKTASFETIVETLGSMQKEGIIRGYGMCNDNCFGLTASHYIAKAMGLPAPVTMQNDYSLINRRIEENGQSEASSPIHTNTGFMAYNVLAGGVLTGKYLGRPTTYDNPNFASSMITRANPRGRHDDASWGRTLYRYRSGPALEAVEEYSKIAAKHGLSLMELALLWGRDRKAVTTQLLGMSNKRQLVEDLQVFKGSKYKEQGLPSEIRWEIDRVHMRNRLPIFSSTKAGADWYNEGEIGERIP